MALIKEGYIGNFGIPCEYWKIVDIHINLKYKWCDITLDGYSNQRIRMAEQKYEPLERKKIRAVWSQDEFGRFFTPYALSDVSIYDQAYEFVKQDNFFVDAKDELSHVLLTKASLDTMRDSLPSTEYKGSAHEAADINQKERENEPIYPPILENPDMSIPDLEVPKFDEEIDKEMGVQSEEESKDV